jgi:hypothetical protein
MDLRHASLRRPLTWWVVAVLLLAQGLPGWLAVAVAAPAGTVDWSQVCSSHAQAAIDQAAATPEASGSSGDAAGLKANCPCCLLHQVAWAPMPAQLSRFLTPLPELTRRPAALEIAVAGGSQRSPAQPRAPPLPG